MKALILPGLNGSGPDHWQTHWERRNPRIFQRIEESDWNHPDRHKWVSNLEAAVRANGPSVILVAHSLGCLQVVHWAAQTHLAVRAALLVAPPNPNRPDSPPSIESFKPVPTVRLPFPSLLIASDNDPYADLDYSRTSAETWGSRLIVAGSLGHINAASRIGDWLQGYSFLESLAKETAS